MHAPRRVLEGPADNEIMMRVRDGEVSQLGLLFERHQTMLYNFFLRQSGNREASQDMVQEVFLRILRYRQTFRGESKFTVWMYSIARNAYADHFRKRKKETPVDTGGLEASSDDPLPHETMEQDQEVALLRRALDRLSSEKREVLMLSRFQNLKYEEISQILNCPVGTIKARVHWAIKDLRKIFEQLSGAATS
ncbi:MAG: RNA polymerase sigma factor [bacterium]